MQHTVQQQLIDELSQLRATLDSADAPAPREKPDADPGRPRSALELARSTRKPGRRSSIPVRELVQRVLPLLDD